MPLPTFDVDLDEFEEARVARLLAYDIPPDVARRRKAIIDRAEDERIFAMLDALDAAPATPVWARLVRRRP